MEKKYPLKKFASIFLASSLVAGALAGCSSSDDSGKSDDSSDVIKIGANLELSGNVASYGSSIGDGVELAVEEINKNGGIDGKKIELVKVDNKSDTSEAAAAALKLVSQEKVSAMIAPATSGNVLATVDIANDNKVPSVTASGTNEKITINDKGELNDYLFRTCFIDPFQGVVAANFATEDLKVKNVAIYYDKSSDYSKGLATAFKEQIKKNGGTVVAEETFLADDTDFKSTLTNLKSKKPDFIYIPAYYETVGPIVKQAREIGITAPLMGGDGWDSPTLVELAGKGALNNTYFSNAFSSQDPDEKVQNFVKIYKEKFKEEPNGFNALGYDTVYFIAEAIKQSGSTDGKKIKDALESTKDFAGVTGTFSLDDKHNPIKSATILEFKDGNQVFKTKVNP